MLRLVCVLACLLVFACKPKSEVVADAATTASAPVASPPATSSETVVARWSAALNAKDINALGSIYGDNVKYYGSTLDVASCMSKASSFLEKNPSFHQELSNTKVETRDASHVVVTFTKTTSAGPHVYACHLVLERGDGGAWKIIEESDAETDANLAKAASKCLTYEVPVKLSGTVMFEDAYGIVPFEGGFGMVKTWILHLDAPVCVDHFSRIDMVQVIHGAKLTSGAHVTLAGTLTPRISGTQYADVLLDNL